MSCLVINRLSYRPHVTFKVIFTTASQKGVNAASTLSLQAKFLVEVTAKVCWNSVTAHMFTSGNCLMLHGWLEGFIMFGACR